MKRIIEINVHLTLFQLFLITTIIFSITPKDSDVFPTIVKNQVESKLTHTYTPKEVDSLDERKTIIASPTMKRVETIENNTAKSEPTNSNKNEKYADNPLIYSTVVKPKLTTITRATL